MPSATEEAVRRFEAALQLLESVIEARLAGGAVADDLTDEVHMLTADRARLAETLDQTQARAAKLENMNRDVSRRLGAAVETIRAVLTDGEPR